MNWSSAAAGPISANAAKAAVARPRNVRPITMCLSVIFRLSVETRGRDTDGLEPGASRLRPGRIEHVRHAAGLDDTPACRKIRSSPSRRACPMSCVDQDDRDAASMRLPDQLFDRVGRSRIEACRRFVKEQHPRRAGQRTGRLQAAVLTTGQDARRPVRQIAELRPFDRLRFPVRAFRSADPAHASAKRRLASTDRRSMTGR